MVAPHEIYDTRLIPDLSDEFLNYGYLLPSPPVPQTGGEENNNSILCSCIMYLKSLGKNVSGDAWNLQPNTSIQELRMQGIHNGAIALFRYPNHLGHAALVTNITEQGFYVSETNYKRCTYTERFIKYDNRSLIGFYQPL